MTYKQVHVMIYFIFYGLYFNLIIIMNVNMTYNGEPEFN